MTVEPQTNSYAQGAHEAYARRVVDPDDSQREALHARVDHDLSFHSPRDEATAARLDLLRVAARQFGHTLVGAGTPSRELSLALTHLEDALHAAIASVVRYQ